MQKLIREYFAHNPQRRRDIAKDILTTGVKK